MSLMVDGPRKFVEIIAGENHVAVRNVCVGYLVKRQRHLKLQRPMLPDPVLKPFAKAVAVLGMEQNELARLLVGPKRRERFLRAPRMWHVGIERERGSEHLRQRADSCSNSHVGDDGPSSAATVRTIYSTCESVTFATLTGCSKLSITN